MRLTRSGLLRQTTPKATSKGESSLTGVVGSATYPPPLTLDLKVLQEVDENGQQPQRQQSAFASSGKKPLGPSPRSNGKLEELANKIQEASSRFLRTPTKKSRLLAATAATTTTPATATATTTATTSTHTAAALEEEEMCAAAASSSSYDALPMSPVLKGSRSVEALQTVSFTSREFRSL